MIRVSGLYIYPIKSCRGIALAEAEVGDRGFVHDREWMVVDPDGKFMTQRGWSAMARVVVRVSDASMVVEAEGMPVLEIDRHASSTTGRHVRVWNDECAAHE
jgi:uncharacterized protein YcbX